MSPRPSPRRRTIIAVIAVWACVLVGGLVEATRYQTTAGAPAEAPTRWPRGTALSAAPFGATVVMFVHPKCPCTRASDAELAAIRRAAPLTARFEITSDLAEARRFGVRTSGHVVVYDATGELRFSGGITPTRGHIGPNLGHDLVEDVVHDRRDGRFTTPVLGCALEAS